jgi:hypothetical protein
MGFLLAGCGVNELTVRGGMSSEGAGSRKARLTFHRQQVILQTSRSLVLEDQFVTA